MWAARDKDGTLWFYSRKPSKKGDYWDVDLDSGGYSLYIPASPAYLPEVKWEDDEPTKVNVEIKHKLPCG